VILRNESSFKAGWVEWQIRPPKPSVTFVVKGTFDLKHGATATLSAEPADVSGDLFLQDDLKKALVYSSDLAPFKPMADVFVSGCAYVPGKGTTDVLRVSFQAGRVSKSLAVIGDRLWRKGFLGSTMTPIIPFRRMDLTYDRSYGGEGYAWNPLGRGYAEEAGPDGKPALRLPNLEDPAKLISSPSDTPEPAGFGPFPLTWPQRMSKSGTYKGNWLKERFPWFPDDFNWGFFNAAPPDQQAAYFRGDEKLRFENLHRDRPIFESALPGYRVRCFYAEVTVAVVRMVEVPMVLDTVYADLEREKLILVWRGDTDLERPKLAPDDTMFVVADKLTDPPTPIAAIEKRLRALVPGAQPELPPPVPEPSPLPAVAAPSGPPREELARQISGGAGMTNADLTGADLSGFDLSGQDLSGCILAGANLRKANLAGTKLVGAVLAEADLSRASLKGADLSKADFSGARLAGADLSGARLDGAVFEEAMLPAATLTGAQGKGVLFTGARLRRAVLKQAVLPGAVFADAVLNEADLSGAILAGATFEGAYANPVKFNGADLTAVKASGANFRASSFRKIVAPKSVWQGARLYAADFSEADLSEAEFSAAYLEEARFNMATLRRAKLMEAVMRHAELIRCDLFAAGLSKADLTGANFSESNLFKADLLKSPREGAKFQNANVQRTWLVFK